jgi:uncharacterized membrane protein YqjE
VAHRIDEVRVPPSSALTDLPRLLNRFVEQVLQLLETQIALLKTEIRESVDSYTKNLVRVVIAGVVGLLGFLLFNVAIALWLDTFMRNPALSFAMVGGFYLVIGGGLGYAAVSRLRTAPVSLPDSRREIERDKNWLKSAK